MGTIIMKKKFWICGVIPGIFFIILFSCTREDKSPEPLIDIEGNIYKTVRIGEQLWMAENLKATMYNDGEKISLITDASEWRNSTKPGYCWYNNDESSNKDTYGALYNAFTVNTGKLCPTGWHVPEMEEFQKLEEFIADTITPGGKLKETGFDHWLAPNTGADNRSGFTARGAGIRYFEGSFSSILYYTSIWSGSESGNHEQWYIALYYNDASLIVSHRNKMHGFSVRCIKDQL